jgi:hypothetical protein
MYVSIRMYGPKTEVSSSLSLRGCHYVLSAVAPIRPPNRLPALRPPGTSASEWGRSGQAGVSFWCLDFVDSHYWSFFVKISFFCFQYVYHGWSKPLSRFCLWYVWLFFLSLLLMAQQCFYDEYEVYDALSDVCMEKNKMTQRKNMK